MNDANILAGLVDPLRTRVVELLAQAKGAVYAVSGRRTTTQQVQLRRQHCGTTFYDVWQKPASQCSPPTAIPGSSEHETGQAVDLGGDLALAARLAGPLGLVQPVKNDPVHFELATGTAAGAVAGIHIPGTDINVGIPHIPSPTEILGDALGVLVKPFVQGVQRIALVAVLLAGGVGLVVLGGLRGTQSAREATS